MRVAPFSFTSCTHALHERLGDALAPRARTDVDQRRCERAAVRAPSRARCPTAPSSSSAMKTAPLDDVAADVRPLLLPGLRRGARRLGHLALELLPELAQHRPRRRSWRGGCSCGRGHAMAGQEVVRRTGSGRDRGGGRARARRDRRRFRPPCAGRGRLRATRAGARGGARGTIRPSTAPSPRSAVSRSRISSSGRSASASRSMSARARPSAYSALRREKPSATRSSSRRRRRGCSRVGKPCAICPRDAVALDEAACGSRRPRGARPAAR